jgi:hypothetical protein
MNSQECTVQTIVSVIFKELASLHIAWLVMCTIASRRLGTMDPAGCKTTNICCSFIDHTVRNKFYSNFGFRQYLRNASCIEYLCGTVLLIIKQPVYLGDISYVLFWKIRIQVFQCRKLLSTPIQLYSTSITISGYLVTNRVHNCAICWISGRISVAVLNSIYFIDLPQTYVMWWSIYGSSCRISVAVL